MKKLKKALLINWFYYEKQLIEFDDINFITGNTGAGKSTFLDAMQIVLLGEPNSRNFNKAANEGSARSLKSYLRADNDEKNPDSRRGRAFQSYIACEFNDDFSDKAFTIGIVFECYADGEERPQFFAYDGSIPDDCYIKDRKPMDIPELRSFLKGLYKTKAEFYDSNKRYRDALVARWNIHTDRIFSMLKKAISFKPIVNIQQFITENICDMPDRPDIVAMQQNIQDYKHQEKLAERQQQREEALQDISALYGQYQKALDRFQVQSYLVARADKEIADSNVLKLENERVDLGREIEQLETRYQALELSIRDWEDRIRQLQIDQANSDIFREREQLEQEKKSLQAEISALGKELDAVCQSIRVDCAQWLGFCRDFQDSVSLAALEELKVQGEAFSADLLKVAQLSPQDFSRLSPSIFSGVQTATRAYTNQLQACFYAVDQLFSQQEQTYDANEATLIKLRRGIKDYPAELLSLKETIETALLKQCGHSIPVHILADLLEISDPAWQGAVEGYLGIQKFYLLVTPAHYAAALQVLDQAKRSQRLAGYGLIDIEKLSANEKAGTPANSLAAVVTTENAWARAYIDYLLGRVVCCQEASQLRQHRIAVTPGGMLYQGYVARPLSPRLMEDAYIGKRAVEQRRQQLEQAQTALKKEVEVLQTLRANLERQKGRDILFTERYVQEVLSVMPEQLRRKEAATLELSQVEERYGRLDLTWLMQLGEEIKRTQLELQNMRKEKEECHARQEVCKNRLHELDYEALPDCYQWQRDKNEHLEQRFAQTYVQTIGAPRYDEELERRKTPLSILRTFRDQGQIQQSEKACMAARQQLVYARREYVGRYPPCAYHPDCEDNDEFDGELRLLREVELPKYREKIKKARDSALEQFQNDFLNRLSDSIRAVQNQVEDLNKALKKAEFGGDQYRFCVGKSPDYEEYYDMIMAPEQLENSGGLFSLPFQNKYGPLIDGLFSQIVTVEDETVNARKQSELQANIERFTDYRTYLRFDLETTDRNGTVQRLSQTLNIKSGGETQTPFYIAVLASFAQIYRVNDNTAFGNTVRLVVFDEAFNKMDSDRIVESIHLLRKMHLQAIISTPPDKLADIMPEVDRTLLVCKDKYRMQILPWAKELEATLDE